MVRRSILSVFVVALAAACLAPAAQAQQPRLTASTVPLPPAVNPAPGQTFTTERVAYDCTAADPAAESVTVRCWTTFDTTDKRQDSQNAPAANAAGILTTGFGQLGAIKLNSFSLCAEAVFTYPGGATETLTADCAPDDLGWATAIA